MLKQVKVRVPPLPVQRRIAGILSAYDELMENSQRRIRLLETMARALYREWFVHFRFPATKSSRASPPHAATSPKAGRSLNSQRFAQMVKASRPDHSVANSKKLIIRTRACRS